MMDSSKKDPPNSKISGAQLLLESAAERLPTPDGVALALMEAWEDERTTVQQIARLVQTDPALSGRVLKLANSAAAGRRSLASVPDAIVRVGMQTVGQLAVAFSLIGKESSDRCPGFDHQQYWARCLLMAVLSRGLGESTRLAPPDDLFACGLLARIGILGLVSVYPEAYSSILSGDPGDLDAREKEVFGVDHNELSEAMMLDFFVPRALAEPARFHEAPNESGFARDSRPQKLAVLLHLAYRLSDVAIQNDGRIMEEPAVIDAICGRLGLAEGQISRVFDQAIDQWGEWAELLQLPADKARSFEDLDFSGTEEEGSRGNAEAARHDIDTRALAAVVLADVPDQAGLMTSLAQLGIKAEVCSKPSDAMHRVMDYRANLFFVSAEHVQLIEMLRTAQAGDTSHVFVVLARADVEQEAQGFAVGADDVIVSNISAEQLAPRLQPALRLLKRHERWRSDRKELRRIAKELALSHRQQQVLALTDQLTELPNRRAAMEAMEQAWSSSLRADTPCALLILDIDHFKSINDRFGHAVGDQVLHSVAAVLKDAVRRDETIARIGGEEFLLISPHLPIRESLVAGERLRRQLERAEIDAGGEIVRMTASIGVAVREESMQRAQELLIAADKALYAAKTSGRNRIAAMIGGDVRMLST